MSNNAACVIIFQQMRAFCFSISSISTVDTYKVEFKAGLVAQIKTREHPGIISGSARTMIGTSGFDKAPRFQQGDYGQKECNVKFNDKLITKTTASLISANWQYIWWISMLKFLAHPITFDIMRSNCCIPVPPFSTKIVLDRIVIAQIWGAKLQSLHPPRQGFAMLQLLAFNPRGQVAPIHVYKLNIVGANNGLTTGRRQAIIPTNAGILLIRPWGTTLGENWLKFIYFALKKMHLKMLSGTWRPYCLGLKVFKQSRVSQWRLHGPITRYEKLRFAHAPEMLGTFFSPPTPKETAG